MSSLHGHGQFSFSGCPPYTKSLYMDCLAFPGFHGSALFPTTTAPHRKCTFSASSAQECQWPQIRYIMTSWWDMGDNEGNLLGGIGRENVYVCVVRHGWYQSKASMGLERGHLPSGPCRPGGGGCLQSPGTPRMDRTNGLGYPGSN